MCRCLILYRDCWWLSSHNVDTIATIEVTGHKIQFLKAPPLANTPARGSTLPVRAARPKSRPPGRWCLLAEIYRVQPIQHDFATCWLNVKPLSGRYCSRCSSSLYPAAQRQKFPTVERKILLFRYFRCGFVRSTAWQNQKSLYKIDSLHIKIAPMEIFTEQQSSARTAPEPSRPERLVCSLRRRYIPETVLLLSLLISASSLS